MAKKNQESPYPPQVNYDQFAFEIGRKGQRIKPVDIFSNAPAQLRTLFEENKNPLPESAVIYGHFKNRSKNVNGCIVHHFEFLDKESLFLKEAPRDLAITESTGAHFVIRAGDTTNEPVRVLACKFNRSVKIKANLFQYGAFIFRTDKLTNELKVSLACLAQSSLFLRITNKTKSLETFGAWFYGWWDWHVEQRAQINLQRKNELLEKAHQGDTYIDPWINQTEALTKLKKKDFPKLFVTWEALKKSKSQKCDSEIKKKARFAFIAEWRALTGKTPKWIDQSELTFDEKAVAYLCRAHSRKAGSKSNALTWWLAINWTKYELFLKNPKELAECYFEKTGVKISSSAIKQARYLAELKGRLKRGKKPSIQPSK